MTPYEESIRRGLPESETVTAVELPEHHGGLKAAPWFALLLWWLMGAPG